MPTQNASTNKLKILLFAALLTIGCNSLADNNFLLSEMATQVIMRDLKITSDSTPTVQVVSTSQTPTNDAIDLNLVYPNLPPVHISLRGPKGFMQRQDHSLRTLFMATGFFTGADNTVLLGDVPNTVFVGFEYPYTVPQIINDAGKLLQTFRLTPGQMALSMLWLSQQSWLNPSQLTIMGVSLGGLFLPAALHIAQDLGVFIGHTVFAYTGADIKTILQNNLQGQVQEPFLQALLFAVPGLNVLNDPNLHLPYLHGSFLVIHADQDQIIPPETSERLYQLLPGPKKEVILHGNHIDIDKTDLIEQVKEAVLAWLATS